MTAIVVLNIIFAAVVLTGIVTILTQGIVHDNGLNFAFAARRRRAIRLGALRSLRRPSAAGRAF
jgi:hypothetical protein